MKYDPPNTANLGLATHRERERERDGEEGFEGRGGVARARALLPSLLFPRTLCCETWGKEFTRNHEERGNRQHNRISYKIFYRPLTIGFRNKGQLVNLNPSSGKAKEFERSFSSLAPKLKASCHTGIAYNERDSC